jgi:hypothetical protein
MKAAGSFVADPGWDAIVRGITDGRALGATFYLYALVLAPVFVVVLATGNLGQFANLGTLESRWALWHAAPAWFWTTSVLLGRLVSVALGVVAVYLTYRLGTRLRDRRAGRLAAVAVALSPGVFASAHLVGEDLPMLVCLLLTILLADRYVESGHAGTFLWGCLVGGLAIAFKLSGGAGAVALGAAYLERARREEDTRAELVRPTVLVGGLLVGLGTIYVAIPSVLVGGPGELVARATGSIASKTGKSGGLEAPIIYWLARQTVQAIGLPLTLAGLVAGGVGVGRLLVRRESPSPTALLTAVTLGVFLAVYLRWEFLRVRHVVPLVPFAFAFAAAEASRWYERKRTRQAVKIGLVVVLLTTLPVVATAESGYVTDPRDEATRWLSTNAEEGATVEVYENSVADVGAVHRRTLSHYDYPEENATNRSSLVANDAAFTAWMLNVTERRPEYVQLTGHELDYLNPTTTDYRRYPRRRAFIRNLLAGEYNYTVAARFGHDRRAQSLRADFRNAVFSPDIEGQEEVVVILERTD